MGITNNLLPVQSMPSQAQSVAPSAAQSQSPAPPPLQPISVEQLNREHAGLDAMINRGIPLAKNPNLTADDIIQELASLVSDDHITAQMAMQQLASLPKGNNGEPVQSSLYQQWVAQRLAAIQDTKNALLKHYGPPIPKKHHEAIKAGKFNHAMMQEK